MVAIYAGSFDPITNGHLDVIERARAVCSHLIVAIAHNPVKTCMFSIDQRKDLIVHACRNMSNVSVIEIYDTVAEYAYENGIHTLVRGIRNSSDMESEQVLAAYNKDLYGIDTMFFQTTPELSKVSSSAVKTLAKEYFDVGLYAPLRVKHALEIMNGLNLIGVTGNSGSGKSLYTQLCCNNSYTFSIDMDSLGHEILKSSEPYAINLRTQLINQFDLHVTDSDQQLFDRKELGKQVFENATKLAVLNKMFELPMRHLLRKKIKDIKKQHVSLVNILIDGAVLVEHDKLSMVNNNIIHVSARKEIAISRIMHRDNISEEYATNRYNSQLSVEARNEKILDTITRDGVGHYLVVSTDESYVNNGDFNKFVKITQKI